MYWASADHHPITAATTVLQGIASHLDKPSAAASRLACRAWAQSFGLCVSHIHLAVNPHAVAEALPKAAAQVQKAVHQLSRAYPHVEDVTVSLHGTVQGDDKSSTSAGRYFAASSSTGFPWPLGTSYLTSTDPSSYNNSYFGSSSATGRGRCNPVCNSNSSSSSQSGRTSAVSGCSTGRLEAAVVMTSMLLQELERLTKLTRLCLAAGKGWAQESWGWGGYWGAWGWGRYWAQLMSLQS
jgi:hypothetical protein